ncbi:MULTISPECIES: DUF952 domain-containing protein [unclassified Nocardioides]|uniref:DUF952 domain-containing protein n=1 Tax=unclassified Nocardioides TaxID=2615069 RepID=UPI0009EBF0CA|nr:MULTISPECIES: DUF952 domain-containing protein [unclassified Nocardioides]
MATIFHLALASDWTAAQASGAYTTSTLGRTLAEEGFIHASRADQWTAVRERFYADVTEPLVLLQIDTDLLDVPVVEEPAVPGGSETFPHIYGRLPAAAVVKAIALKPEPTPATTATTAEPVRATPAVAVPTTSAQPAESFSRVYFREMFFNMAMLCIALAAGTAGILIGDGIGGLVGLAVGGVIAVAIYRSRHANAPTG